MIKKIAIVTYQNGKNYGGFLQVYALQKILEKITKYKVEVINYKSLRFIIKELRTLVSKNPKIFFSNFLSYCSYFIYRKKINLRKFTINKKKAIKKNYKFIVYGSDEIWNFNNDLIGYDSFYFGKNCNTNKFAFSASFGTVNKSQPQLSDLAKHLKNFNKISIRDLNSSKILKKFNIKHDVTLDPVFLYNFKKELSEIKEGKNLKDKYILIYGAISDKKIIKNINLIKTKKKLKTISIGYNNEWADKNIIYSTNPFLFLKLFKDSELILTSMFHGVVLSLKFRKKFLIAQDDYRTNKLSYLTHNYKLKFIKTNHKFHQREFLRNINKLNIKKNNNLKLNIVKSLNFIKNNFK